MKKANKKMSIDELKKSNAVKKIRKKESASITGGKTRREAELEAESCANECG